MPDAALLNLFPAERRMPDAALLNPLFPVILYPWMLLYYIVSCNAIVKLVVGAVFS